MLQVIISLMLKFANQSSPLNLFTDLLFGYPCFELSRLLSNEICELTLVDNQSSATKLKMQDKRSHLRITSKCWGMKKSTVERQKNSRNKKKKIAGKNFEG